MTREIHFFTSFLDSMDWIREHNYLRGRYYDPILEQLMDYEECERALDEEAQRHYMTEKDTRHKVYVCKQMCFLDTAWLVYGFRIFVHDKTGQYEIKLGSSNERTHRDIRAAHNLFKMWSNGEFKDTQKMGQTSVEDV